MVFLREGGKDELSILLEKGRRDQANATAGPSRLTSTGPAGSPPRAAGKGKRKAEESTEPAESLLHRLAGPSTNKAGLKRDPNEVRQIIYQSSKGGHYFNNEERKDEKLTAEIEISLKKLEESIRARGGDLTVEEKKADRIIADLEAHRDLSQTIVVVDCDAFYASVEELDNPSLIGKAFGVGEGVLTTASYEARKYGCRSAMPGYIAKKLCPHLIFVKLDFTKYIAASGKVMAVLERYDPNYSPASLDEAYMNLTPYLKKTGLTADQAIQQMREEVKQETGLTVSAGCGPNTMTAKIAADFNKPDGQYVVEPTKEGCKSFMDDLSVRKIPGIGRVTERWLEALGVVKCRDIYRFRAKLVLAKGDSGAAGLFRSYLGISSNVVERGKREDRRGVGHETTFSTLWRPKELDDKLKEIAASLAEDMARLQYSGRTLTLKLKLETYEVLSRSHTPGDGLMFHTYDQLYKYGKQMLDNEVLTRAQDHEAGRPIKGKGRDLRLRLMGLKVSGLRDDSEEAVKKSKGKGSLYDWAKKASTSTSISVRKSNSSTPIDLTSLSDDDDDDDGYDDISLSAAPCPRCHKTVAFDDHEYEKHILTCSGEIDRRLSPPMKREPIDLSLASSQDDIECLVDGGFVTLPMYAQATTSKSTTRASKSKGVSSKARKEDKGAFTQIMQSKQTKKTKSSKS